jgi:hypothetical protein
MANAKLQHDSLLDSLVVLVLVACLFQKIPIDELECIMTS